MSVLAGAPICAAVVFALVVLFTAPAASALDASQLIALLVSGISVTAIFELLLLLPLWYVLRAATVWSRGLLFALGVGGWILAATLLGAIFGHGGVRALGFATSLLLPGVVLSAVFAVLMPARSDA
jgi:hypothetical protein